MCDMQCFFFEEFLFYFLIDDYNLEGLIHSFKKNLSLKKKKDSLKVYELLYYQYLENSVLTPKWTILAEPSSTQNKSYELNLPAC